MLQLAAKPQNSARGVKGGIWPKKVAEALENVFPLHTIASSTRQTHTIRKERGQISKFPPYPHPVVRRRKRAIDSLLATRSGYRAALNGSELRRNAGRVMPARGACTCQTATEGGTRRGRVNTPAGRGGAWQRRGAP
eukprot:scaffold49905_cov65-Phaeocystis_antarctica.AAC.2